MSTDSLWKISKPLPHHFSSNYLLSTSWILYQLDQYYVSRCKKETVSSLIKFNQKTTLSVSRTTTNGDTILRPFSLGAEGVRYCQTSEYSKLVFFGYNGNPQTTVLELNSNQETNVTESFVFSHQQHLSFQDRDYPVNTLRKFTLAMIQHRWIYLFGGMFESTKQNLLFRYDVQEHKFKNILHKGTIPSARVDHSCCTDELDLIYIFGGSNVQIQPENDLYVYSVSKNEWNYIPMKGTVPGKRSGHKLLYVNSHRLLMQGGAQWKNGPIPYWDYCFENELFIADLQTLTWIKIDPIDYIPMPCVYTSFVLMNNWLVMIGGGMASGNTTDEVSFMDLITLKRFVVSNSGCQRVCDVALQRIGNTEEVYYFGGFSGEPMKEFTKVTFSWITMSQMKIKKYISLMSEMATSATEISNRVKLAYQQL